MGAEPAPEGSGKDAASAVRRGDTVRDAGRDKVGQVMGFVGPYVQLRPVGGGIEWDARPELLRSVAHGGGVGRRRGGGQREVEGGAAVSDFDSLPVDVETMRATTARMLTDAAGLPTTEELGDLVLMYRGHLMVLIPEIGRVTLGRPKDDATVVAAWAGVGEARRLGTAEYGAFAREVEHARSLARSVVCLLGHLESLGGHP